MRTILTILLTSLFWSIIIYFFFEPAGSEAPQVEKTEQVAPQPQPTKKAEKKAAKTEKRAEKKVVKAEKATTPTEKKEVNVEPKVAATPVEVTPSAPATTQSKSDDKLKQFDPARELIGKWKPIEGAEYPLEFTKYGTAIQYRGYENRIKYSIKGQKLSIYMDLNAKFEITKEGENFYLEIYNTRDFSGKYKRESQPKKIAMRQLDESTYAEKICGKWTPINGQEHSIEFSKYGTAIQYRGYENRVDYTLTGSKLNIYMDNNASVVISEDNSNYYLEIFNSTDFSGRYRKSK